MKGAPLPPQLAWREVQDQGWAALTENGKLIVFKDEGTTQIIWEIESLSQTDRCNFENASTFEEDWERVEGRIISKPGSSYPRVYECEYNGMSLTFTRATDESPWIMAPKIDTIQP